MGFQQIFNGLTFENQLFIYRTSRLSDVVFCVDHVEQGPESLFFVLHSKNTINYQEFCVCCYYYSYNQYFFVVDLIADKLYVFATWSQVSLYGLWWVFTSQTRNFVYQLTCQICIWNLLLQVYKEAKVPTTQTEHFEAVSTCFEGDCVYAVE